MWSIKMSQKSVKFNFLTDCTGLLLLLYCHSPHRTVGILFCAFSLATTIPPSVHFLMLSIQPVFLHPGLAFPSTSPSIVIWTRLSDRRFQWPHIDSFSFLTGQADLPLLILLPFSGSIHWSFYLSSQPEAFYAIPTTQMILSSSCHFAL